MATRESTIWLLDSAEDGCISWEDVARAALAYMSEDDVRDMCAANDFPFPGDQEDEDEEDETKRMVLFCRG